MVDQSCGSGMFIPDPHFLPSQILDSTRIKKRRWINFLSYLFVAINFTKWKIILLWKGTKKFEPVYKQVFLSSKQLLRIFHKYGFGIRNPEKTHLWYLSQGSKKHRIPDPDSQHCRLTIAIFYISVGIVCSIMLVEKNAKYAWTEAK